MRRGEGVFFFQAEDGIRDLTVTGVQTCALPISDGYATGQRLSLLLRPESLTLVPESAKAAEGEVVVPGVVRARTFLGEKVEYVVEAGGALLQAVYDPTRRGVVGIGARVGVMCDAAAVRLLAAEP